MHWVMTFGAIVVVSIAGWVLAARRVRATKQQLTAAAEREGRLARELAEQQRATNRHAAILRGSMDGFFVVCDDCRFLEVNEAFCRMTGYSADELRDMKISDLEVPQVSGEDVPSHMRTGLHHFPTAHRHKDGHIIFLEIGMNVLRDDGQRILAGFARDVTERKRAGEEFERLSRRQQHILNSTVEGICGVDQDGRITFANPAASRMLASAAADLVGRSLVEVATGADHAARDCPDGCVVCSALRKGLSRYQSDAVFQALDGRELPVEYSITPMYEGVDVIGAVAVFRDITERKQAEQHRRALESQIQQVQKLDSLGMLAGGIAHDLNNMLVGILGNACLAVDELPDISNVRGRLQRIIAACERASKVISQILAYSGRVVCEPAPIDPNEFLGELTELLRPGLPERIKLRCSSDPGAPPIAVDVGQMQQVITNLVTNARDAIGDVDGEIVLEAATQKLDTTALEARYPGQELAPGEYVRVLVRDSGCGIARENVRRIFEPFFSEKGPGRGLGLAAMRGIVRAHGGGVRVESEPGVGTTFTLVFPVVEEPLTPRADRSAPSIAPGATVLVIDDDDAVRDVVGDILEARGLRVLSAEDGRRGLDQFKAHADELDLVLLDMTMPGMSGAEVFQEIIAIAPEMRVVILSGYSENNVVASLDGLRPVGFVHKPFSLDELIERVGMALDRPDAPAALRA